MKSFKLWLDHQFIDGDGETFWAGDGGGASGILPIAKSTGRVCFAWRSNQVQSGNCWGTLGGAIQHGLNPQQSAIEEMKEETGYHGPIQLHPAYVFKKGSFTYYNFIGIVPQEFPFASQHHSWETDRIEWFDYQEALKELNRAHPGLVALFQNSKDIIEKIISSLKLT